MQTRMNRACKLKAAEISLGAPPHKQGQVTLTLKLFTNEICA